jgi:hypothetical protein
MQQFVPDIIRELAQRYFLPVFICVILGAWLADLLYQSSCSASCTDQLTRNSTYVNQLQLKTCVSSCVPAIWFALGGAGLGALIGEFIHNSRAQ